MKLKYRFTETLLPFLKQKRQDYFRPITPEDRRESRWIIALLILWFIIFLISVTKSHAQEHAVRIGDKIPDIHLTGMMNYSSPDANISDFKGKILILDFWATWCSPCISSMPKWDSLQKQFSDKIQVLQVAYQPDQIVRDFFTKSEKLNRGLPKLVGIANDQFLVKLFPHTTLPHVVVINQDGIVSAITEDSKVDAAALETIIRTHSLTLPEKHDEELQANNDKLPLFINGNSKAGTNLIYHSLLSAYVPGLEAGSTLYPLDSVHGLKITLRDVPLMWLFKTAYQERKQYFNKSRIVVQLKDSTKLTSTLVGEDYLNWLKAGNGFCYELIVPPGMAGQAYQLMQKDMSLFFPQYMLKVEQRERVCWVLSRINSDVSIATKRGTPMSSYSLNGLKMRNVPLKNFIDNLNGFFMQDSPYPIVDDTGYSNPVDLEIEANLHDIKSLNSALARYGLEFKKAKRNVDVLFINDNLSYQPLH